MKTFTKTIIFLLFTTSLLHSCTINMENYYGVWTDGQHSSLITITPQNLIIFQKEQCPIICNYSLKGKKIILDSGYEYASIDNKARRIILTETSREPLSFAYSLDELNFLTGDRLDLSVILGEWEGIIKDVQNGRPSENKLRLKFSFDGFQYALGKGNYSEATSIIFSNWKTGSESLPILFDPVNWCLYEMQSLSPLHRINESDTRIQLLAALLTPGIDMINSRFFLHKYQSSPREFSFEFDKITDNSRIKYAKAQVVAEFMGVYFGASMPNRYDYYSDRAYENDVKRSAAFMSALIGGVIKTSDDEQINELAQRYDDVAPMLAIMGVNANAELSKYLSSSANGQISLTLFPTKEGRGTCSLNIVAPKNYYGQTEMSIKSFQKSKDGSTITYDLVDGDGNKMKLSINIKAGKATIGNLSFSLSGLNSKDVLSAD